MADVIVTGTSSGTSSYQIKTLGLTDASSLAEFFQEQYMSTPAFKLFPTAPILTDSEREFAEQQQAFEQIPPLLLEQYRGRFVASMNGRIVDSDEDFVTLTRRFFETFGDVAVYITKIGDDAGIVIDTPFFD